MEDGKRKHKREREEREIERVMEAFRLRGRCKDEMVQYFCYS
jgi:hypothetical protein